MFFLPKKQSATPFPSKTPKVLISFNIKIKHLLYQGKKENSKFIYKQLLQIIKEKKDDHSNGKMGKEQKAIYNKYNYTYNQQA